MLYSYGMVTVISGDNSELLVFPIRLDSNLYGASLLIICFMLVGISEVICLCHVKYS